MTTIPENMQNSAALQFVISQGWDYKVGTAPNIILAKCPYCSKDFHCYMELHSNDGQTQRDGLHMCQRCGKSNNIYGLKQHLGISIPGVSSQKDWASSEKKIDPLPDINACHEALLADDDAVEYLCNIRGFSLDIVKKQKIGLTKHFFKSTGKDTRALVFPYLVNNNPVWVHYRTLPDPNDLKKVPKDFASPRGYEATLFNIDALNKATNEIVLVEGECNTIAALDKGIENICGVPGANIKKAEWLDKIEKLEKVYILYDKDKVGQKAAQELASRVGIEKCYKIVLPDFEVVTESGETRKGKDLNEWFVSGGGTAEEFYKLKDNAVLFGVDGVASTSDALDEFTEELTNKGASQKYVWPIIADIVQFDEGDVIDILAEEKIGKSTVALNLVEYMVDTYKEDAIFISTEMTRAKLARKWVCHKAGICDSLPKTADEAAALTEQFKQAIPSVKELAANREGTLYIAYPKYSTMDEIYKLIIDCIRRYGVKWIVVDNIQRLCDLTIGNRNRTQWLSEISKRLSQIAKDYNVQLIRIIQPHKIGEGKMTVSGSVDGSSQINKDCDCLLIANRAKISGVSKDILEKGGYIQSDTTFAPEMLLTCALSRYSAGGEVMVYFDGATSTVHKLTEGKVKAMKLNNPAVGYEAQSEAKNLPLNALKDALGSAGDSDGGINI